MGILVLEEDALGFVRPRLASRDACINCNICQQVCTGRASYQRHLNVGEVWAVRARDARLLDKSSSGGAFPVMARFVLDHGGVVYGAAFDEGFEVVRHQRVTDVSSLSKLQGSKYLQSLTEGIFSSIARDLASGRTVLFSGTPCQVDALRLFLEGKDCKRLYLIDLFCYGVPSPRIWRQWLANLRASRDDAQVVGVNSRDKAKGWQDYALRVDFDDGTSYVGDKAHDLFLGTFSKGGYLRESCYSCVHKAFPRSSDLTLGDFQEIDAIDPALNRRSGISMVKINTEKGRRLFDEVVGAFEVYRVEAQVMDAVHPGMGSAVTRDRRRDGMLRHVESWDVRKLLLRYGRELPATRVKKAIKRLVRTLQVGA